MKPSRQKQRWRMNRERRLRRRKLSSRLLSSSYVKPIHLRRMERSTKMKWSSWRTSWKLSKTNITKRLKNCRIKRASSSSRRPSTRRWRKILTRHRKRRMNSRLNWMSRKARSHIAKAWLRRLRSLSQLATRVAPRSSASTRKSKRWQKHSWELRKRSQERPKKRCKKVWN